MWKMAVSMAPMNIYNIFAGFKLFEIHVLTTHQHLLTLIIHKNQVFKKYT